MFSEDLYDKVLIELTELIDRISPNDIRELWAVSHIDQQKHHFVILFGNMIQKNEKISNEHAISIRNGQNLGTFEHEIQIDFTLIDSIRGQYVFTPKVQHHVKNHSLYGKGFGLIKKALNLAIETGGTEKLYEMHQKFIADMEQQLAEPERNVIQSDDKNHYRLINNPPMSRTKSR
ncbi:31588_t:CDS:2, partial [Racocetra persica]